MACVQSESYMPLPFPQLLYLSIVCSLVLHNELAVSAAGDTAQRVNVVEGLVLSRQYVNHKKKCWQPELCPAYDFQKPNPRKILL